jgi:hypothetical protein
MTTPLYSRRQTAVVVASVLVLAWLGYKALPVDRHPAEPTQVSTWSATTAPVTAPTTVSTTRAATAPTTGPTTGPAADETTVPTETSPEVTSEGTAGSEDPG